MEVKFYDSVPEHLLKFAVIVSRYQGQWVYCKHKERDTFECPGGHREPGEDILTTAKRELMEETAASDYTLTPVGVYSVTGKNGVNQSGEETFGKLYFAEIKAFHGKLVNEIESVHFFKENLAVSKYTYPLIQPKLLEQVTKQLSIS